MDSTSVSSSSSSSSATTSVNQKIHNDLQLVVDKMNGCELLLKTHSAVPSQELLAVVGFLEACQPRLVELVEAAAQGALSEQVLMECLQVNDRLTKILSDVDSQMAEDVMTTTAVADEAVNTAASSPQFTIQDETNDDLLLMEDFAAPAATTTEASAAGLKTTGEETGTSLDDLLDLTSDVALDQLAIGDDNDVGGVKPTKSEDEFDDFISSRQAN